MSRLSRKIAWRYLFSKKSHSAINAISIVSVCGVAITTLALICTLSVYNGFTQLIGSLYSQIDPQIKITPREGKTLDTEAPELKQIASWPEVAIVSPVIEENALCQYKDRQQPVLVKGVPDNYTQLSHIEELITSGTFMLNDGRVDYVSLGIGIAAQLGIATNTPYPVELYAPNRLGRVNLANPAQSFNSRRFFVAGVFCSNQAIYDDQLVMLPLATAREMFSYTTEATAIELRLAPGTDTGRAKQRIARMAGPRFLVQDRYEQQADVFRIMESEKLISYLFLTFILILACFNLVGSLSMLMLEKRDDVQWTPPADWFESRNLFEAACKRLGEFMGGMKTDYETFWGE